MTWTWIDWLLLSMAVCLVLGAWFGWFLRGAVDERQAYDEEIEKHEATLAARQAPRHAAAKPREFPAPAGNPPQVLRTRAQSKRLVTTAGDIAPVIIPQPGTRIPMRPQPSPEPSHDTVTFPKVVIAPDKIRDTGELRAIGAAWEEKTRREQAVWSHEYHQRCEADRQEAGLTT